MTDLKNLPSTQFRGTSVFNDCFFSRLSSEQGMDLLVQLGLLTDMQFSCPTGMTGSYARGKRLVLGQNIYT